MLSAAPFVETNPTSYTINTLFRGAKFIRERHLLYFSCYAPWFDLQSAKIPF